MRGSRSMRFLHVPPNDRATAGEAVKKAATALFDLEAHSNVNRACSPLCSTTRRRTAPTLTKFASDIAIHHRVPQPQLHSPIFFSCKMTEIKCKQLFNNRPRQIRSSKRGDDVIYHAKLFMCHRALPERSRGVRPLRRELFAVGAQLRREREMGGGRKRERS